MKTMDTRFLMSALLMLMVVGMAMFLVIVEKELPEPNGVRIQANERKSTRFCILHTDVVFVHTPACGSDMVQSVLSRFGHHNGLLFTLPSNPGNPYIGHGRVRKKVDFLQLSPAFSREWTISILANQMGRDIDKDTVRKIFREDAKYVTILRNPLDRFETDFLSSKLETQFDVKPKSSPPTLAWYLDNPEYWEARKKQSNSYCTRNCMSKSLGIPGPSDTKLNSGTSVMDYIKKVESEFTLVLIYEDLNKSLVLLRRYMCWEIVDILYDVGAMFPPGLQRQARSGPQKLKFRQINDVDHLLYYHFYDVLLKQVAQEGGDFQRELKRFEHILDKVSRYCSSEPDDQMVINRSEWNEGFAVHKQMCDALRRRGEEWDKLVIMRHTL